MLVVKLGKEFVLSNLPFPMDFQPVTFSKDVIIGFSPEPYASIFMGFPGDPPLLIFMVP